MCERAVHGLFQAGKPFGDGSGAEESGRGVWSRVPHVHRGAESDHDGETLVDESVASLASDRSVSVGDGGYGQAGGGVGEQGVRIVEACAGGAAGAVPFSNGADFARAQDGDERADLLRGGKNLAGGGRGYRGDN